MKRHPMRERSTCFMTNLAARLFGRAVDRRLKAMGMSSGQLPVFFALSDGGAMSQKALLEFVAIEQPTLAATLSRMERDGWIQRRPDPADGRSSLISLTPAATEKLPQLETVVKSVNGTALEGLGDTEREVLMASLRSMVASLDRSLAD